MSQKFAAGGSRTQIVSYLYGSWFVRDGWMVDVGVGQFNEDTHVKNVDLECLDTDVHWFAARTGSCSRPIASRRSCSAPAGRPRATRYYNSTIDDMLVAPVAVAMRSFGPATTDSSRSSAGARMTPLRSATTVT